MKKIKNILFVTATTILIASCGGKKEEPVEELNMKNNPFAALQKIGQNMGQTANKQQEILQKRREKGDTLAIPYAELQKYLPAAPSGYAAEEPTGATINMGSGSYSNAEIKYKKGEDWIKITIADYNQAAGLYTVATSMWALGISVDTPEEKAGGIKMDGDIGGWEVYKKKSKDASVVLGVGYRFWVSVEASNQDGTDKVKEIAKSLDLKKLSEM